MTDDLLQPGLHPASVFLVDDHPIVLEGLRALIGHQPHLSLAGAASTGEAALRDIPACRPDIAVIDLSLPGLNGRDLLRLLSASCPSVSLLVLTVHEEPAYVERALAAGARGFVLKRSAADILVQAIETVMLGGTFVDPLVADRLSESRPSSAASVAGLSEREVAVLKYLAQGFSNKEVANVLSVSVKSVETYKSRALEKLNLRSRADIVRFGAAQGWISAD